MAYISSNLLFFTTSPRTPNKMIPEIEVLKKEFEGKVWNSENQEKFIDALACSEFYEGVGSAKHKAFSARDRINRAPKALGFVDLKPVIKITGAGEQLLSGKRLEEVFLRQLLKFQFPSPFHIEKKNANCKFYVKPYLEIFRLIFELEYLTFDELKIFGMQLVDYRHFDEIKEKILKFRNDIILHKGEYKKFVDALMNDMLKEVYSNEINAGNFKTRESKVNSLKKFLLTKKRNLRDYTDACFRYLRSTGMVSISHKNYSISIEKSKIEDVKYFLKTVDRNPIISQNINDYKDYLFNENLPILYNDNKDNLVESILKISSQYTRNDLISLQIAKLKDLKEDIITKNKETVIEKQIMDLKSYALYSEIVDTFNEIISDELYDAPLMLEWNTWRAMTMINGGKIKGNFKIDDNGAPMSTAPGNMPDIVCDYGKFFLAVEVTMQTGQRQYDNEGEPVARHYGNLKRSTGKNTYCLFIAPSINRSTLAYFYGINKISIEFYGGKSQIIPIELDVFMKLVENSYSYKNTPDENHIKSFLEKSIHYLDECDNELDWITKINDYANSWLL